MAPSPTPAWQPRFTLTPAVARRLMEIEAARAIVAATRLPLAVESELRNRARLRATHYSTRIEGNRLTLAEAEQVVGGRRIRLHGRERDAGEVRNYWRALLKVEEWAARSAELTEELIQRLHALVEGHRRPSAYRDGQNTIRDSETGALVYLPPEARDVPGLMAGLVAWVRSAEADGLPLPIVSSPPSCSKGGATGSTASCRSKRSTPGMSALITSRLPSILTTTTMRGGMRPI
jgi:Fic family protein